MSKQYKDTMKGLGERLKSEPVKTPIQEVRPVEEQSPVGAPKLKADKASEAHFNFWAARTLMQRVKFYSAKSGKSIREICTEAIDEYLKKVNE